MSALYFCLAVENQAVTNDLLDEYYAAMLFHKIAIVSPKNDTKAFYLLKAAEYYKNISIRNDIKESTLAHTYKYLSDVYFKLHDLDSPLISQPKKYYKDLYEQFEEKSSFYFTN